jgi:hypothetical protein
MTETERNREIKYKDMQKGNSEREKERVEKERKKDRQAFDKCESY